MLVEAQAQCHKEGLLASSSAGDRCVFLEYGGGREWVKLGRGDD